MRTLPAVRLLVPLILTPSIAPAFAISPAPGVMMAASGTMAVWVKFTFLCRLVSPGLSTVQVKPARLAGGVPRHQTPALSEQRKTAACAVPVSLVLVPLAGCRPGAHW
jgi:hypothetical protein